MTPEIAPQVWWLGQKVRYGTGPGGLKGEVCGAGHPIFPPRDVCPDCADQLRADLEQIPILRRLSRNFPEIAVAMWRALFEEVAVAP